MRWTVLTLFPAMFDSVTGASLFGKAVEAGRIRVDTRDIRDSARDKHRVVDDTPYGGGAGMVMKVQPLVAAIESLRTENPAVHVVLLSPQGQPLDHAQVVSLSEFDHIALVCGRYEGVDERVRTYVDAELSIGDYVLSGGEPAAWVVMDAVSRLVPGVLGRAESAEEDSFSLPGLLEYPQYTRPRDFRGAKVPEVLMSGDHGAIRDWRRKQSLLRTAKRRPDLLGKVQLDHQERNWLKELGDKDNT